MILAADGTARAIAPDGTPRGLRAPDAADDVEDSTFVPWSRWRNGGRGDMACERGDIGGPSQEPLEVVAGVQAPNRRVRRGGLLRSIRGITKWRVCIVRREQGRGFRN